MPLAQSRSSVPGPPAGRPHSERGRSRKGVSPLGRHAGGGGGTRGAPGGLGRPAPRPPRGTRKKGRPTRWLEGPQVSAPAVPAAGPAAPAEAGPGARRVRPPDPVDAPGVSAAAPSAPSARGPQPALLPLVVFPPESSVYKQKETTHDQTGHKVTPPGPAK